MAFSLGEVVKQFAKLLAKAKKLGAQRHLALCTGLRRAAPLMAPQVTDAFASARDRVALVMKELANQHGQLDISTAVLAMRAPGFLGT
jgi:hypothetical protein